MVEINFLYNKTFFFILELIDEFIKTSCFRYAGHMGNIYHIDFSEKNVTNGITFGIRGLLHTPLPPSIHLKISRKSKKIFSVEILHFWMTLLMWV